MNSIAISDRFNVIFQIFLLSISHLPPTWNSSEFHSTPPTVTVWQKKLIIISLVSIESGSSREREEKIDFLMLWEIFYDDTIYGGTFWGEGEREQQQQN